MYFYPQTPMTMQLSWIPYNTAAQEIECVFKFIHVQMQFIYPLISYLWNGRPSMFTPC